MKALVYTAPNQVEIQDAPKPRPGRGEVLVKVDMAGICGSDLDGFLGLSRKRKPPLIMGHEFIGEVSELGEGVSGWTAGQQVIVQPLISCGACDLCQTGFSNVCEKRELLGMDRPGAYAEYITVPVSALFAMPEGLDPLSAVLVEPLANAVHLISRTQRPIGGSIAIFGAGTIGLTILQVAFLAGYARAAIVDTNSGRLEIAQGYGADLLVNARETNPVEAINQWLRGGVDVTVDAVGRGEVRQACVQSTKTGGESLWIGLHGPECPIDGRDIVVKEIAIKGSYAYTNDDFVRALDLLNRGAISLQDCSRIDSMDKGQEIFSALAAGTEPAVKVALRP